MEEQLTTGQAGKKWGVIYGLIATILVIIPLILEIQATWMPILNILVAVVIYVLASKEFKNANGGYMTFGEGFRISMVAALIAGVMRGIVNYVYVKFIDPEVTDRMQEALENAWREQGMTEQEISQMQGFSSGFSNPEIGLIVGIIFILLGALVWGSIVSAVIKNEAEDF